MSNQPKCIAFYLRSATGNLVDLKRQRKVLEREFVKRGFDLTTCSVEIYRDTHQSGLRPGPEFQRMHHDVVSGKIDAVMVARMNRISRSLSELMKFNKFVESQKIRFVSAEENVDSVRWHSTQHAQVGGGVQ